MLSVGVSCSGVTRAGDTSRCRDSAAAPVVTHLTHAYAKLGVTGRNELKHALTCV
jgi:DNA-binding CsgD family transcriptional regulator